MSRLVTAHATRFTKEGALQLIKFLTENSEKYEADWIAHCEKDILEGNDTKFGCIITNKGRHAAMYGQLQKTDDGYYDLTYVYDEDPYYSIENAAEIAKNKINGILVDFYTEYCRKQLQQYGVVTVVEQEADKTVLQLYV